MNLRYFSIAAGICILLAVFALFLTTQGNDSTDGPVYFLDEDGQHVTQAGFYTLDGVTFYVDDQGIIPQDQAGLYTVDGVTCYVDSDGTVPQGQAGLYTVNDCTVYVNSRGIVSTGTARVRTIDGVKYFFDSDGYLVTTAGKYLANGIVYYVNEDGIVPTGSVRLVTIGDCTCYVTTNGVIPRNKAGLYTVDGCTCYVNAKGIVPTGTARVRTIDNVKYYFDSDGQLVTGAAGIYVADGLVYYVDEDGVIPTDTAQLITIDNTTYYVDTQGEIPQDQSGYYTVGNRSYYIDDTGIVTGAYASIYIASDTRTDYDSLAMACLPEQTMSSDDMLTYILENRSLYTTRLISFAQTYTQVIPFAYHYIDCADLSYDIDLTWAANCTTVPLLLQWDLRWGYQSYSTSIIGCSACGPVCLSMVALYLTQDPTYTPVYVANYSAGLGYYTSGVGTSWALMTSGARGLGLSSRQISVSEASLISAMENNHPVICSVRKGIFTQRGHYIVITGYQDGEFTVNDPNSVENSQKTWTWSQLQSQIRVAWEFWV